jgi:hypothetical protein
MRIETSYETSPEPPGNLSWDKTVRIKQENGVIYLRMPLSPAQRDYRVVVPRRFQAAALITVHEQKPPFPEGVEFLAPLQWPGKDSALEQPTYIDLHQEVPDTEELECFNYTDWWNHLHLDFPVRAPQLFKHWQFRHHQFPTLGTMLCIKGIFKKELLPEDLQNHYVATRLQEQAAAYTNAEETREIPTSRVWTRIFNPKKILWTPELLETTCNHLLASVIKPPKNAEILKRGYEQQLIDIWNSSYKKAANGTYDDNNGILRVLQNLGYPETEIEQHPKKDAARQHIEIIFRDNMPSPGWFLNQEKSRKLSLRENPDIPAISRWLYDINTSRWNPADDEAFRHYAAKFPLATLRSQLGLQTKLQMAQFIKAGKAPKSWIRNPKDIDLFYYLYREQIPLEDLLKNPGWGGILAKHETKLGTAVRKLISEGI